MKTIQTYMKHPLNLILGVLFIVGCATAPQSLIDARTTYKTVSEAGAAENAPSELKAAEDALAAAEEAFDKLGPDDEATTTLAYIATRKAELAGVVAETYIAEQYKQAKDEQLLTGNKEAREDLAARLEAKTDLNAMTNRQLQDERAKLLAAEEKLEDSEMTKEELAAERIRIAELTTKLDAEREARAKLEADLARVRAELEKVATIKEEPTRMIITLNGSVLFETAKFAVLPAATLRLDQVAQVLAGERNANITVMGYTDSKGSDSDNQRLSENRANSVRNYLVQKGVAQDRITAQGLGESNPVAPNDTETGRANNRRVEIVVDRDASASLQ